MRHLFFVVAAAALAVAPALSHAAVFDPNELGLQCTSGLSIDAGDKLILRCAGSLRLSGMHSQAGLLASDSITVEAGGDLTLDGVHLTAPRIDLITRAGQLRLDDSVVVHAQPGTPDGPPPLVTFQQGGVIQTPQLFRNEHAGSISSSITVTVPNPVFVQAATAVPEPASWFLALAGLGAGLTARRLRRA